MSSIATSEQLRRNTNHSFLPIPGEISELNTDSVNPVVENIRALKTKYLPNFKTANLRHFPAIHRKKKLSTVNSYYFFADKHPLLYSSEYFAEALQKLKLNSLGVGSFLVLVLISWAAAGQSNFVQGSDFIYNSGIVGGLLMLVAMKQLIFNRVGLIRQSLSSDNWQYIDIVCGILGAYFVVLHSSFNLTTISGSLATAAILFIILCGSLGRYLSTLSTLSFHKQYEKIREVERNLFDMMGKYECFAADRICNRLSRFTLRCYQQPKNILQYYFRFVSILSYGIYCYVVSARDLKIIIGGISVLADLGRQDVKSLLEEHKRELRIYLLHILKMGYTSLIEHTLRHWRIIQKTMLYLLVVTSVVHVFVVHM